VADLFEEPKSVEISVVDLVADCKSQVRWQLLDEVIQPH